MPTISSERLRKITTTVFKAAGSTDEEAELVTDCLVSANLLGVDSHGVSLIPEYLEMLKKGLIKPNNKPKVIHETPNLLLLDGNDSWGYIVAKKAMELAIKKAKKKGIAVVSIRSCNHIGRLGYWAMMAAKEDMIGIITCSSGPAVAPYGGVDRVLGPNPICIAVLGKEYQFLLDISTSMRASGWIRERYWAGEKLPPGWMINDKGEPVLDPSVKYEMPREKSASIPFGGYKGYGLEVMVDLLTGCLVGDGCSLFIHQTKHREYNPTLIIVINIATFTSIDDFKERVDFLFKAIKNSRKAPGVEEILIPGEPEWRTQRIRSREGIPFTEGVWKHIVSPVKEELGIDIEKIE